MAHHDLICGYILDKSVVGVYGIRHTPSGKIYIGASSYSIRGRLSNHFSKLRAGKHQEKIQSLWDTSEPGEWEVLLLEQNPEDYLEAEDRWLKKFEGDLLNFTSNPSNLGRIRSAESRRKSSESRRRYLESSESREILSRNARKQHESGKLGRSTWSQSTEFRVAEGMRVTSHIATRSNSKKYRGINQRASGRYTAKIVYRGNVEYLGTYNRLDEAVQAWNSRAKELYGESAYQNPFPDDPYENIRRRHGVS